MLLRRAWLPRPVELKPPVAAVQAGRHGRFYSTAKSMYVRVCCDSYESSCSQAGIVIAVRGQALCKRSRAGRGMMASCCCSHGEARA